MSERPPGFIGDGRCERIFTLVPEHKGAAFVSERSVQNISRLDCFAVLRRRPHDIVTVELFQGEGERYRFVGMGGIRQIKAQVDNRIHRDLLRQYSFFSSGVFSCGGQGILSVLLELNSAALQAKGTVNSILQLHRLLGAVHGGFGQRPGIAFHVFPHGHDLYLAVSMSRFGKLKAYLRVRIIISAASRTS